MKNKCNKKSIRDINQFCLKIKNQHKTTFSSNLIIKNFWPKLETNLVQVKT